MFRALACLGLLLAGCSKSSAPDAGPRLSFEPLPAGLAEEFSGERAYAHVETLTGFGPRPPGSDNYERALAYLEQTLSGFGWTTRRQSFAAATPDGPTRFTNLLARHESAPAYPESLPILIGGHLDTKKMSFEFVGANDSGSSTGILVEFARVLATDPAAARKVEIVLFDGEEAFRPNITPGDGLYGSKHFAREMSRRPSWPAFGVVLDIVGDPDHALFRNPELPEGAVARLETIATGIGFPAGFRRAPFPIIDDHVPMQNSGMPCLHLIGDFQSMDYWHQPGDTLGEVTPEMLGKVGRLTLRFLAEPAVAAALKPPAS